MTPAEALACCRRYVNSLHGVFVFEYGTCVVAANEAAAKKHLATFNVPGDGEGSVFGDIWPLDMDDGNTCILFSNGDPYSVTGATCWTPMTKTDLEADPGLVPQSKTEVFSGLDVEHSVNVLRHGLVARANRGRDARELNVVVSWVPG